MAKAGDKRRLEANTSKLRLLRTAILAALVRLVHMQLLMAVRSSLCVACF